LVQVLGVHAFFPCLLQGRVHALAFSAEGNLLVSGTDDTTALVWDLTGRLGAPAAATPPLAAQELDACWSDLANPDAAQAYRAMRRLVTAGAQSVAYVKDRLRPVTAEEERHFQDLLPMLDSERFAERDTATEELKKAGVLAEPALREWQLKKLSLESNRRLGPLLENLHEGRASGASLRTLRALEVLEQIATTEARAVLEVLAKGAPTAKLTQEAAASARRLAKRGTSEH